MWNGSSWTAQPTAGPTNAFLSAVSCTAANSCEAVGSFVTGAFQLATLAEVWNGTSWASQSIPNPSVSQNSALTSISCTSASSCTAVGNYQYGGVPYINTLGEVWDGTSWRLQSTPNHSYAGQNILNGVSCGATSVCMAVGQAQDIGGTLATLAETGD